MSKCAEGECSKLCRWRVPGKLCQNFEREEVKIGLKGTISFLLSGYCETCYGVWGSKWKFYDINATLGVRGELASYKNTIWIMIITVNESLVSF